MAEATLEQLADVPDDATLTQAVRTGDVGAYGVLYARHLHAARRVAASFGIGDAEREDLVAEGFARVLRILRAGGGPDEDFRPYLLTTMRNTLISWRRRDSSVSLVADVPDVIPRTGPEDTVGTRMHAAVASEAFASLPERWRTVLWRTEIEGESPAQIAKLLGMSPNGVAALAYRAREGLRQAYLDQYVPAGQPKACRTIAGQLARWVRHGATAMRSRRIRAHLAHCPDCRELAVSLRELNQELPATVAPLILLAQWATTSSAAVSGTTVAGATVSTVSWLTAVKTLVAGAAVVTTAAVGATAAAPPPASPGGPGEVSQPVEADPTPRGRTPVVPLPDGSSPGPSAPATTGTASENPDKPEKSEKKVPAAKTPGANPSRPATPPGQAKEPKPKPEKAPKPAKSKDKEPGNGKPTGNDPAAPGKPEKEPK